MDTQREYNRRKIAKQQAAFEMNNAPKNPYNGTIEMKKEWSTAFREYYGFMDYLQSHPEIAIEL